MIVLCNDLIKLHSPMYNTGMIEVTLSQELQVLAVTRKAMATTKLASQRSHWQNWRVV